MPVLVAKGPPERNPWGITFRQGLFNMTSDSGLFRTATECQAEGATLDANAYRAPDGRTWLPLYEAKMVTFYDHRSADVVLSATAVARQRQARYLSTAEHADPWRSVMPQSWVFEHDVTHRLRTWPCQWLLGFCDITSSTNERTVVPAVIPRAAVGNKLPLLLSDAPPARLALLGASLASLALDFNARQKVGGTSLNFFIAEQLPVLPPDTYDRPAPWDPE